MPSVRYDRINEELKKALSEIVREGSEDLPDDYYPEG